MEESVNRAQRILKQDAGLRDEILRQLDSGELAPRGIAKEALLRAFEKPGKFSKSSGAPAGFESMMPPGVEVPGAMPAGAMEAIVRVVGRPPLLVRNGTYVTTASMKALAKRLEPHRAAINAVIGSTGRIEFRFHRMPWGGTGWMIDKKILVTNRHVAELVTESDRRGGFRFKASLSGVPYEARVDYNEEHRSRKPREANLIIKFLSATTHPDIALFEVESPDGFRLPPPIELATKPVKTGLQIGVVGYPADDPDRNDPGRIRDYFGNIFDVKRFAPGEVSQAAANGILMHDATTLGGNSGSVVFNLETGKAIGLHFAGTFLEGNFALDADTVARVLKGLKTVVRGSEMPALEKKDSTHAPAFFKGRDGYQADFLGKKNTVPFLGLGKFGKDVAEATGADGKKTKILHYRHFSVQYSASRKMPIYTAVNIDGGQSRRIKRGDDQWFQDLRLPREIQLGEKDYGRDVMDRGHMVRREDPVWGTPEEASEANFDTFHYTNACPQHADLNQRAIAWQGLENFILENTRTLGLKVSVFTGPVLRASDKKDKDPRFANLGQIPEEFWKVVAAVDAETGKLYATGYILSQGRMIRDFTEAIVFGDWNTYQVPIAKIAQATGIDFGVLAKVDTFAAKRKPKSKREAPMFDGQRPLLLTAAQDAFLGA